VEILRRVSILPLVLLAPLSFAHSPDDRPNEDQVKAAFLYNFLKFVDWPPAPADRAWVIGVAGSNAFAATLEDTVREKSVNGRRVIVKRLASLADAHDCQIAFQVGPAPAPIPALPGVLTVGPGGILDFYIDDSQVRFEIRLEAAKAAGLHISAQLLKLARIR
jgi:YfiR/HmsC-like